MTRQEILDVIKNKPYLIGHWIGFKDLTTLHNEWIKSFFRFTQNVVKSNQNPAVFGS